MANATSAGTLPRRAAALLLTLGTALALLLGGAGGASAHAALLTTDPVRDSVVQRAPTQVTLTFSEAVSLPDDAIRVLGPNGNRVDSGQPQHAEGNSSTAWVALHRGLSGGTFTVAWKAVSADSHPVAGAFTFSVGEPSATKAQLPRAEPGAGPVGALYNIARCAAYGGFALLVGAAAFVLCCWPGGAARRPVQRLLLIGWSALLVSTIMLLALRGPYESGGGFGLTALQGTLDSKLGAALAVRLLLLAGAGAFLALLVGQIGRGMTDQAHKDIRIGLLAGGTLLAVGLASTWAAAEHASVGMQVALAMPVDVLHLMAMGVWLGGLTTLLVTLYAPAGPALDMAAVHRFSRLAFCSVLVLVTTGSYQTWRQLGSLGAFTSTSYGRLLLAKLACVAVLIGAAWYSRRWTRRLRTASGPTVGPRPEPLPLTAGTTSSNPNRAAQLARQRAALAEARARRERDADPGRIALRRSVLIEVAVAVAVLAITTVLTTTEPGRAQTQAAAAAPAPAPAAGPGPQRVTLAYDTGGKNGKGNVEVTLDPGRSGGNEMHVQLTDALGDPLDVPEVKVAFRLAAKDIGPLDVALRHVDTGHWSAGGVQLPMPGDWTVSLTVRTSDIVQVTKIADMKIG